MKPKQLVNRLCQLEGKKKQVDVAQMKEIVSRLADIIYSEATSYENSHGDMNVFDCGDTVTNLVTLGCKRFEKQGGLHDKRGSKKANRPAKKRPSSARRKSARR